MSTNPLFIEPTKLPREFTEGDLGEVAECGFYVSIDQVTCGERAEFEVQTKNGPVALCDEHMAYHNRSHAQQRVRRQGKSA